MASLVIVGLNSVAARISFDRGFAEYLAEQDRGRLDVVIDQLTDIYAIEGSWNPLLENPRLWEEILRPQRHPPPNKRRRPGSPPPADPLELRARILLLDNNGTVLAGAPIKHDNVRRIDIVIDGARVAELVVAERTRLTDAVDIRFSAYQGQSTLYIAMAVLLIAAVIAAFVARQLTRPVRRLADGARELASGRLERRITVARDDELGDLAKDFNALAATLQRNRDSRRQWVADIAHELRTPLAILMGELQAIEDGIRPFSESTRRSLQSEVGRLNKLVTDMRTLNSSDEGELLMRPVAFDLFELLRDILDNAVARISDHGIELHTAIPDRPAIVCGDATRIEQLVTNLIENSLRYTDVPGRIDVVAASDATQVSLSISDTAPGVASIDLPHLFDRLYRVDASRNRATGGSGLGLAICRAIVLAHDGQISARHSDRGGVEIVVRLPLQERNT